MCACAVTSRMRSVNYCSPSFCLCWVGGGAYHAHGRACSLPGYCGRCASLGWTEYSEPGRGRSISRSHLWHYRSLFVRVDSGKFFFFLWNAWCTCYYLWFQWVGFIIIMWKRKDWNTLMCAGQISDRVEGFGVIFPLNTACPTYCIQINATVYQRFHF